MKITPVNALCWGCGEDTNSLLSGSMPNALTEQIGIQSFSLVQSPVCKACWDFLRDQSSWVAGSSAERLLKRIALHAEASRIVRLLF